MVLPEVASETGIAMTNEKVMRPAGDRTELQIRSYGMTAGEFLITGRKTVRKTAATIRGCDNHDTKAVTRNKRFKNSMKRLDSVLRYRVYNFK